jgi:hypothetical protein
MDGRNKKLKIIKNFNKYLNRILKIKNNNEMILNILTDMINQTYRRINTISADDTNTNFRYDEDNCSIEEEEEDNCSIEEEEEEDSVVEEEEEEDSVVEEEEEEDSVEEEDSNSSEEENSNSVEEEDSNSVDDMEDETESSTNEGISTSNIKINTVDVNDFLSNDTDISDVLLYKNNPSYLERVANYLQHITSY